ncbi:uncharacterized protein LOC114543734 [Dendronephthya gigantea]|uniref:uncharacterized protein LOC114543734 n=1 Tax=Dendronephthya gigantea TaxID=151771 RepID=UPI00106DB898|nr:uncharacterized protein LOC114543734 [Dendronephthya gigantea]
MSYYTRFRHTGFLESFHNHLLMYCAKRQSYTLIGYKMRNQLAAIDFNKHRTRQVAKTLDGKPRYKAHYSKRTKQWCPVAVLEPKEYKYLPELITAIFEKRRTTPGHVTQKLGLAPDDPRNIARNIAVVPQPPMEELLRQHKTRF